MNMPSRGPGRGTATGGRDPAGTGVHTATAAGETRLAGRLHEQGLPRRGLTPDEVTAILVEGAVRALLADPS